MPPTWSNWSESVACQPAAIRYPQSLEEMVAIVNECRREGRGLRVVGSGHSFTPLVATDGVLISLDRYSGLEQIDVAARTATVRGGTKIKALGELLSRHGLAQENLGDIDAQSIAGAISTGTHGTGLTLGSLSTQVIGLTLVTGAGEVLRCSESERPEILRAAQVSLGALGIIASVTLRLVPAYRLEYVWQRETLGGCLDQLGRNTLDNRNFEFYWLPHTDTVMTKRMNVSQSNTHSQLRHSLRHYQELVLENSVLWLISEACRHFPAITPLASGLIAGLISSGADINDSHKIFATPRLVKFQEMEYSLPVENMAVALEAIDRCIRQRRFQVHFPLECRVVRGDGIDLSPAAGRDSAYIAVHMYKGMAYREYFAAMEFILRSYGGRPHWGKLHSLTARELAPLYPRWDHFQAVRASLDPDGVLLNPYLRSILGVAA